MPRKPGENLVIAKRLYHNKVYNKNRPARHKFYSTPQWKKLRDWVLGQYPLCQECLKNGVVKKGQVVDHIVSIEDGGAKTDITNLRVLCIACHNRKHFTKKKC